MLEGPLEGDPGLLRSRLDRNIDEIASYVANQARDIEAYNAAVDTQARKITKERRRQLERFSEIVSTLGTVQISDATPSDIPKHREPAQKGLTTRDAADFASAESRPQAPSKEKLKVFLCHSSEDKDSVRTLYHHLSLDWVAPWLDEQDILPGSHWEHEVQKALKSSHVVLVCLSEGSIRKTGFVQKEIATALDFLDR